MTWIKRNALYIVWLTALVATIGSLYFQYVMNFPPCVLCWYQRIAIYPLAVLIPLGVVYKDKILSLYTMVFSAIGLVIALYHNLLYHKILPESIAPCIQGFSCTTKFIEWFGFITIPLFSFAALGIMFVLSLLAWQGVRHEERS